LFLLLLAIFLFPIAVYCAILGVINRRAQPLLVSGAWDFLGVLLATSGFLLFVGPALLSGGFRHGLRELPLNRESNALGSAIAEVWALWWVFWLLYYLFILGGAAMLVWGRRNIQVVYNIEPQTLLAALDRAARRLALTAQRRGNHLIFSPATLDGVPGTTESAESSSAITVQRLPSTAAVAAVTIEPFPLLNNVSLHWHSASPEARADLERELRKALAEVITLENPVGGWLLGIAGLLFMLIMLLTGVFIALVMMWSRSF
jgi:hypothetical protein